MSESCARKTGAMSEVPAILKLANNSGAVLYGDFTLSSGRKTDHYWDGKKVTLSPMGAYLVGKAILDRISDLNIQAVGGLEMGAIPIATAVALVSHLEREPIPAFIVRKNPKEHGTRSEIEGYVPERNRVVILDDVITTGDSVQKAIDAVEQRGCKVVRVVALVDRHEGGGERLRSKGYTVECLLDFYKRKGKTILGEAATDCPAA
jgi:orotate phosphoribosyltransferase